MLAPSSAQAPYPSPRRKRQVSSIPLRLLSKSQSRCWIAILCFLRTSAQRGLFLPRRTHTLAVGAESRTQRRHAPHGAVQAFGTPAESIVPIVFTGRKSALSARLSEIHRLPLLRYVSAKTPFSLRAATLSRTSRVTFLGVAVRVDLCGQCRW